MNGLVFGLAASFARCFERFQLHQFRVGHGPQFGVHVRQERQYLVGGLGHAGHEPVVRVRGMAERLADTRYMGRFCS